MPSDGPADPDLNAAFAQFWEADRASQQARIAILRIAAGQHPSDPATLLEAARVAHGLGGVAAMYGFADAKTLALEIEGDFHRGAVTSHLASLIDRLEAALAVPYRARPTGGGP